MQYCLSKYVQLSLQISFINYCLTNKKRVSIITPSLINSICILDLVINKYVDALKVGGCQFGFFPLVTKYENMKLHTYTHTNILGPCLVTFIPSFVVMFNGLWLFSSEDR